MWGLCPPSPHPAFPGLGTSVAHSPRLGGRAGGVAVLTHYMLSFASLVHFLDVLGKGGDLGASVPAGPHAPSATTETTESHFLSPGFCRG